MALSDKIDEILADFGKSTVDDTRANLDSVLTYGSNPSKLSAKIRYVPPYNSNGALVLDIYIPNYGLILDKGRGKGNVNREGIESIEKWIVRRGLVPKMSKANTLIAKNRKAPKKIKDANREKAVKQFAFAIARKIQKEGHNPKYKNPKIGFWSKVINDGRLEELTKRISEVLQTEIIINITNDSNK